MLSVALSALQQNLRGLRTVLRTHDAIRQAIQAAELPGGQALAPPWSAIAAQSPKRTAWQVHDHCSAFTRLYAVYEEFVCDLIKRYLEFLPVLYKEYSGLPAPVRNQYRAAVGQMLQKWGDKGPYAHLTERAIIEGLANGLTSSGTYTLLDDAFLIDRQNYRAETIHKIFGSLNIANCWAFIDKFPPMARFMSTRRDSTENPSTILHDIVEQRNLASHANPTTIVSSSEFESYSEFIGVLSEALLALLKRSLLARCFDIHLTDFVATVHRDFGRAKGLKLCPGFIRVGEELAYRRGPHLEFGIVRSIQQNNAPYEAFTATTDTEVGITFEPSLRVDDELFRLKIAFG